MTLSPNWKVKIFTTSLIKSWPYEFLSLIDLKILKSLLLHPQNFFGLESQGGCNVAANILHGFDCTSSVVVDEFYLPLIESRV